MTGSTYENKANPMNQQLNTCVQGSPNCPERDNFNAYNELKSNAETIQTKLLDAKKTWYASANKAEQYKTELAEESKVKAREKTDDWKVEFDLLYKAIEDGLLNVKSQESYCPNAESLDIQYRKLTENKNKNIKKTIKQAHIDHRLAGFYDNSDYYEDLLYYFKWVYWVMFIFCIVMLFISGQYRNVKTYVFFIVLAAFPTLIMQPTITWVNTHVSQVKINTMYFSFLILGSLVVSMLYYSGNYAMPTEKIIQTASPE